MNSPTTTLSVVHRCGCSVEYRISGPKETLDGLSRQLATENCKRADCPRKQARRNYRAPIRG